MSWWLSILVDIVLKVGLPWAMKHLSPEIVAIIKSILEHIGGAADKVDANARVANLRRACEGVGCPVQPVK